MEGVLANNRSLRQQVGGWWLLGLIALAVSTLFAVLLVVARSPLLEQLSTPTGLFREALVMHVNLAVVVWFLSCAAGFWTLLSEDAAKFGRLALTAASAGLLLMFAALFSGNVMPILANYVPVLDSPIFLSGLGLFLIGVSLSGLTAAVAVARQFKSRTWQVWHYGLGLSIVAAVVATGAFLVSLVATGGVPVSGRYEILAWGPGHVLQFIHVLLLMSAWTYLTECLLGKRIAPKRWLFVLFILAAVPLVFVPVIYLWYPVGSAQFRQAFTLLMSYGAWPAAALLAVGLLAMLASCRASVRMGAELVPLALSMLLFLLGCLLGSAIRSETTMVPAHYHCTVGAVTLAYMAIGYRMLAAFGFAPGQGRLRRWQPVIYGAGLLVLALALAWSGWLGVPRKTMSSDLALQSPAYLAAMGFAGLGGLLAISGAALFVFNIVQAILLVPDRVSIPAQEGRSRWGWGMRYFLLVLSGVIILGYFYDRVSVPPQRKEMHAAHARQKIAAEVAQRFQQGVLMLHAKRPEDALTAFHRVIELAPEIPEAHVNMGYALLELKRYEAARDFFESATVIKPNQFNAYYGLAEALEALGDLPGAIGAMRTYVHLAPAGDPYRRNAESALWEWDEALKRQASASPEKPADPAGHP